MSKFNQQIGVVSQTAQLPFGEVQRICEAIDRQMVEHHYPAWGRTTRVTAFESLDKIPIGFWPAVIKDDIGEPGASGFHSDNNNQPFIEVQFTGDDTSVSLSHECLEIAPDPFGNRLIVANLPSIGECHVLCEIGDPCERQTYEIDGVKVSDFILPEWYDAEKTDGVKYTYLNSIDWPCTINEGGYCSFIDTDGQWGQITWFSGHQPITRNFSDTEDRLPDENLREWIDRVTRAHRAK